MLGDKALLGTNYDVRVDRFGAYPDSKVMATLSGLPQVTAVIAEHQATATIPGIKDPMPAMVMRGEATRLSYHAYQGRWFQAPGEVVMRPVTMREAHLAPDAQPDAYLVKLRSGASADAVASAEPVVRGAQPAGHRGAGSAAACPVGGAGVGDGRAAGGVGQARMAGDRWNYPDCDRR